MLNAAIGKTLMQVDRADLFVHHEGRDKVKGIAGDIVEVSILGCQKDSRQEPDILVDGVKQRLRQREWWNLRRGIRNTSMNAKSLLVLLPFQFLSLLTKSLKPLTFGTN